MTTLGSISVCLCLGVVVYGVLTLPSWLFTSMNRGTLWSLRDAIWDARKRGELPYLPAVDDLLERIEGIIVVMPQISALMMWRLRRHYPGNDGEPEIIELDKATPDQQSRFYAMQVELGRIVFRHYLLCSWSGLFFATPRHREDLRWVLSRRAAFGDTDSDSHRSDPKDTLRGQGIVQSVEEVAPELRRAGDLIAAAG